jgi:hypothetical protein
LYNSGERVLDGSESGDGKRSSDKSQLKIFILPFSMPVISMLMGDEGEK